jgi:molybdate transport system regulatory protein
MGNLGVIGACAANGSRKPPAAPGRSRPGPEGRRPHSHSHASVRAVDRAGPPVIIASHHARRRHDRRKEQDMKYGARNTLTATVKSVKIGEVMSLVKFDVTSPAEMGSVLTTESVEHLDLKVGDEVRLVIKASHVLPVKV